MHDPYRSFAVSCPGSVLSWRVPYPRHGWSKKNPQALVESLRIERLGERVLSDYFTSNIIFLAILVDHDLIVSDKLLIRHHVLVIFYYIDTC